MSTRRAKRIDGVAATLMGLSRAMRRGTRWIRFWSAVRRWWRENVIADDPNEEQSPFHLRRRDRW